MPNAYKNRCEGWTKPGAFMFAPAIWSQCTKEGEVWITFKDGKKNKKLPACKECWQKCIDNKVKIISVIPITEAK